MRAFLTLLSLALTLVPLSALSETLTATSAVTEVTLYPRGAQVTRVLTVDLPAGHHRLRIVDLPQGLDPALIRLSAPDETVLGAFTLQEAGLAPTELPPTPEADAAVAAAQAARDEAALATGALEAQIAAAEARIGFLRAAKPEVTTQSPQELAALARMVGDEVLAARAALPPIQTALAEAERALARTEERLAAALAAQDDLRQARAENALLEVAVNRRAAGAATITLQHFVADAGWRPVYDLSLTRKPAPRLTVDRGVLVSQSSGEDWRGVTLTVSTAQPDAQSAPSELWPDLRRVAPPEPPMAGARVAADAMLAEPVMEAAPAPAVAVAAMQGDILVYRAPDPVDVATGVQDLRVALGTLDFTPELEARAVPRFDASAYLMVRFTNGDEVLLPGTAYLLRDGTLVGSTELERTPAKASLTLPFGVIDGLRLTRDMPENLQGDAGLFTSDTARREAAVLRVENLTDESWPVHLMDQVPYSEQSELEITYSATPAPTETDPEGQRGLLSWRFDLPAGASKEIRLTVDLRWPAGLELR